MLIDIPFLREQCQDYLNGCDWPIDNDVPRALLRILDAFDAMEREKWKVDISGFRIWHVMNGDGEVIAYDHLSPLAALLAAAEGKSDG